MCLRFVFLLTTRLAAWLWLARREETWKTAETFLLRHQLAVLQRQQPGRPRLDWADRVLIATLLAVIPKARRRGLRLLVTPDTILRWHRDIIRRRWAARSILVPVAWKTASNELVKFDPRSRIKNLVLSNRSPRVRARLRACCTVH
jgi:hypothetical protein